MIRPRAGDVIWSREDLRQMRGDIAAARAAGVAVLNATIRADNRPGLAYYARLGFVDYSADPGWALKSGAVVGRVSRRLDL